MKKKCHREALSLYALVNSEQLIGLISEGLHGTDFLTYLSLTTALWRNETCVVNF